MVMSIAVLKLLARVMPSQPMECEIETGGFSPGLEGLESGMFESY
jgi:hypothetical protein